MDNEGTINVDEYSLGKDTTNTTGTVLHTVPIEWTNIFLDIITPKTATMVMFLNGMCGIYTLVQT